MNDQVRASQCMRCLRTVPERRLVFIEHMLSAEDHAIRPETAWEMVCPACSRRRIISTVLWKLVLLAPCLAAGLAVRTPVWLLVILSLLVLSPVFEDTLAWWGRPWRR